MQPFSLRADPPRKISQVFPALLVLLLYSSCASRLSLGELDEAPVHPATVSMLDEVEASLSREARDKFRRIRVRTSPDHFYSKLGGKYSTLILPEAQLNPPAAAEEADYLSQLCGGRVKCGEILRKYNSVYFCLHDLYHITHREAYLAPDSIRVVTDAKKRQRMMSFSEEIEAEKTVVGYLRLYHPGEHERLYALIRELLAESPYAYGQEVLAARWNSFSIVDYREMNYARLAIYVAAADSLREESLEALLFPDKVDAERP